MPYPPKTPSLPHIVAFPTKAKAARLAATNPAAKSKEGLCEHASDSALKPGANPVENQLATDSVIQQPLAAINCPFTPAR